MKLRSAIIYYMKSVLTLARGFNFCSIPLLFLNGKIILRTSDGTAFWVKSLMEIWTIKEVVLDKQYELYRKLETDDVVIDIGAAIGEFAIYAASKSKFVYAYEVVSERVNRLNKNIDLNDIKNIGVFHQRAGSLEKILNDNEINHCNFLKVDCEGCEYEIFREVSGNILEKIDYISMEVHFFDNEMKNSYKDMVALLKKYFEVIEAENKVHSDIAFVYAIRKTN